MKKSTKMHWYIYNNTVPLLNVVKTQIFYPVYNIILNIFKFSTILSASQPASQPAIRPGSTSAMAPVFHITKVIAICLQNCCIKDLFTAPWSFL